MPRLPILVLILITACGGAELAMPEETPGDFVALVTERFDQFVTAFPEQSDCIGRIEVRGVWSLEDRARYYPESRLIEVRIPATAPQLTVSLVHELAHHLERACSDQETARAPFLAALGLPEDTPWPDPGSYEADPSELWAEAVVRYVTGDADGRRPLPVSEEAVEVVGRWAQGRLRHAPSTP